MCALVLPHCEAYEPRGFLLTDYSNFRINRSYLANTVKLCSIYLPSILHWNDEQNWLIISQTSQPFSHNGWLGNQIEGFWSMNHKAVENTSQERLKFKMKARISFQVREINSFARKTAVETRHSFGQYRESQANANIDSAFIFYVFYKYSGSFCCSSIPALVVTTSHIWNTWFWYRVN